MPGRRLSFGPFQVDEGAQVVLRDGAPLPVGARGVRLLEALLRRPGEVLTKAELMDAAWPGTAVEESNLSVQMAALRKALGDGADGGDWIATIPRVGYRFVGPAEAARAAPDAGRRSIAVLPFVNLSSDADQTFFADGLAEEIITALAKLPDLLVIARNSSFAYRGDGIDIRRVGEELDVRYVLTGSVRRSGDRLRMSVQLADAGTAGQLWAESYDREIADVFAVQDDVTRQVVGMLQVRLGGGDGKPPADTTRDVEALDLFLRGRGLLSSPNVDAAMNAEGIELLKRALQRAPDYAEPRVSLVVGLVTNASNLWTGDPASALAEARQVADAGIALAPSHANLRAASALVALLERDHERCGRDSGLAVSLNPLGSFVNIIHGGFLVNDAQPRAAIPCYEQAIRADPAMTHLFMHHLGTAYLFAGSFETAAALFRSRIVLSPKTDMSRAYLCVALGHLGQYDEARRVWAELLEINPTYNLAERLSMWTYRDPSYPQLMFDGLHKAGLSPAPVGS